MIVLRRFLALLCVTAAAWAGLVALTGGFRLHLGSIRISSRDVWNPLVLASISAAAVWGLSRSIGRRVPLREEWAWWRQLAAAGPAVVTRYLPRYLNVAPALVIGLMVVGLNVYQWGGNQTFWLDEETISLNVRDRSFAELGGVLWLGQSAPFGWLVLQRAALLTLGPNELFARLVPLLFGLAILGVALWIGRRWMGAAGATVLMLLCSLGQWFQHYQFEVKHYTGDAFWALLLPALAVWATEDDRAQRTRRTAIWWLAAAAGLWLSNGALLVVPACALFLFGARWRKEGWRAGVEVALIGCVWLASFSGHYYLSGRATLNNPYLRGYWDAQFPAAGMGVIDILRWLTARLPQLAYNPGGTIFWMSIWAAVLGAAAWSDRRTLALVFATAPLSAFAFAGFRIVPLFERLTIWIVPAMYVAVALLVDRTVRLGRDAISRRRWIQLPIAALLAFGAFQLCDDIIRRGWVNLKLNYEYVSKHGLDDRAGVRWLMRQHQPGDVIMTTRLAWPAIWWYGDMAISNPETAAGKLPDGSVMLEVSHLAGPACRQNPLGAALKNQHRALVYFGFQDVPPGYADLLLHSLEQLGTVSAYNEFAAIGRAAVIDLDGGGSGSAPRPPDGGDGTTRLGGCIGVAPALRW
ncbi:MAG: hypothetical protein ABI868_03460 [Acidobacteriota bacterium]